MFSNLKNKKKRIFLSAFGGLFLFALIFIFVGIKQARAVSTACSSYDYCAIDKAGSQGNICQEAGCSNQIGRLQGVAYCGTENNETTCTDGLDNNNDGKIDCLDDGCKSKNFCLENNPANNYATCSDGIDNDMDGLPDCLDKDCAGKGSCANWFDTEACLNRELPFWDPAQENPLFLAENGTIKTSQTSVIRSSEAQIIKITGAGIYTSLTLTIGNALEQDEYFPFDAHNCDLSSEQAGQLIRVEDASGHVLQLINKPNEQINNFSLTLACPVGSAVINTTFNYYIAVDALRLENGAEVVESGEKKFETTVLNSASPSIAKIEVAGLKENKVDVPYGGTLFMRAVPLGGQAAGVCGCDFWLGKSIDSHGNINCIPQNDDETCLKPLSPTCGVNLKNQTHQVEQYYVQASPEDKDNNYGSYGPTPAVSFKLNITPIVEPNTRMYFDKKYPFYIPNEDVVAHSPVFATAQENVFNSCQIKIDDNFDSDMSKENGPGANEASCYRSFKAPAGEGAHYVSFTATDNKGDKVTTGKMVFYVCSPNDTAPPCDKADFDQDGTPDRVFAGLNDLSCDNCINLNNPDQADSNQNGIGDACEHGLHCTDNLPVVCSDGQKADPLYYGSCTDCCFAGTCSVSKELCCSNANCSGGGGICKKDYGPWLETRSGDIYGGGVGSNQMKSPPGGQTNATFCILSSGEIVNFSSKEGCAKENINSLNALSSPNATGVNLYSKDVLAQLNLENLKAGHLGAVVNINSASNLPTDGVLGGKVYYHRGDLTLGAFNFNDGAPNTDAQGNGLLFIEGNLTINGDWKYPDVSAASEKNLASLGVVVADNLDTPEKEGNIYFDKGVTKAVGVFYAEGAIFTGNSDKQLVIQGALVAHSFAFERTFLSETEGSEVIIYDGRAQINPPPGLGDFFKTLPLSRQTLP